MPTQQDESDALLARRLQKAGALEQPRTVSRQLGGTTAVFEALR